MEECGETQEHKHTYGQSTLVHIPSNDDGEERLAVSRQ